MRTADAQGEDEMDTTQTLFDALYEPHPASPESVGRLHNDVLTVERICTGDDPGLPFESLREMYRLGMSEDILAAKEAYAKGLPEPFLSHCRRIHSMVAHCVNWHNHLVFMQEFYTEPG